MSKVLGKQTAATLGAAVAAAPEDEPTCMRANAHVALLATRAAVTSRQHSASQVGSAPTGPCPFSAPSVQLPIGYGTCSGPAPRPSHVPMTFSSDAMLRSASPCASLCGSMAMPSASSPPSALNREWRISPSPGIGTGRLGDIINSKTIALGEAPSGSPAFGLAAFPVASCSANRKHAIRACAARVSAVAPAWVSSRLQRAARHVGKRMSRMCSRWASSIGLPPP